MRVVQIGDRLVAIRETAAPAWRWNPWLAIAAFALAMTCWGTWWGAPRFVEGAVEMLMVSMFSGAPWWLTRLGELLSARVLARAVLATAHPWLAALAADPPLAAFGCTATVVAQLGCTHMEHFEPSPDPPLKRPHWQQIQPGLTASAANGSQRAGI